MNKKAESGQGMTIEQLIGIVLAGMIILSLAFVGCNFINKSVKKGPMEQIANAINILEKPGTGEGLTYVTIDLDDNSAVVFLNPNSNFYYDAQGETFSKGFIMKRPVTCDDDATCYCFCESVDLNIITSDEATEMKLDYLPGETKYTKGELVCNKPVCTEIKNMKLKEKLLMSDVFDDKSTIRTKAFWNNSMIILRSDEIKPDDKTEVTDLNIDIAGYLDKALNEHTQFAMKKNSDNTLSICFKDDCT